MKKGMFLCLLGPSECPAWRMKTDPHLDTTTENFQNTENKGGMLKDSREKKIDSTLRDATFDLEFYIQPIDPLKSRIKAFAVWKYSKFYLLYSLSEGVTQGHTPAKWEYKLRKRKLLGSWKEWLQLLKAAKGNCSCNQVQIRENKNRKIKNYRELQAFCFVLFCF